MEDGPPRFPRGSTCPAVLRWPLIKTAQVRVRDCHPLWSGFPAKFCFQAIFYNFTAALPRCHSGSCNPSQKTAVTYRIWRFRLVPVRSPLLGESRLISFPPVTEMFHFTGLSAYAYVFSVMLRVLHNSVVAPFGYLRVKAHSQLTEAFRSLSRPSSAPSA